MISNEAQERNRSGRRSRQAYKARYAPRHNGLPLGKPAAYWRERQRYTKKCS